ncbi:Hypothetical protein GLP15_5193 [Giardia lamblia P15]|uniref:Uncharacterized protein n=1 Tax=Giardia intestinalis (strain P15) TaxID=658858 RepID=E1EWC2_GIAIA|nr:Hypothetical protein GLP15_5193 [Giardia lamblia P15]
MNDSLPRLNNLAVPKEFLEQRPQTLYSLHAFPPKRVRQSSKGPVSLTGISFTPRGTPCQINIPETRKLPSQFSYKQDEISITDFTSPLLVDLFGYRSIMNSAVKQDINTLACATSSQSIGTVSTYSPITEKVILSTYSRPPSSFKTSRTSVATVKSIAIPSLNDALTGPLSSAKARPNSARQLATPISSRSPSPSCLNRDFIHNNRVLSCTSQRSVHAAQSLVKDTVSRGSSVVYSLGLPRESPHALGTPLYELPAQFFLQINSPLRASPPSHESCLATPSMNTEISLVESPVDLSAHSIGCSDASESAQHVTDHVLMDQSIHCKRPTSVPHVNPLLTETKISLPSQCSMRKYTSTHSNQPTVAPYLPEKGTYDHSWKPSHPPRDKAGRSCPQIRDRFTISSVLLQSHMTAPSSYSFKVSARQKKGSAPLSESSQSSQLVPCSSTTEYINGFLDRRGFYPYVARCTKSAHKSAVVSRLAGSSTSI